MNKARILVLDIETFPAEAYTWRLFDVNIPIEMVKHDEYMLCWCAKWLGEKQILSDALTNYKKEFKENKRNDRCIAESLHHIMDEADIIVTHNGNRFDLKWANELFLKHGLGPVSNYRSVDTLTATKSCFRSLSYKLQFRLQKLKIGEKLKHEGWPMWLKQAAGKRTKMVAYCKQDVKKTEEYYLEIRPFIKNHPNLSIYTNEVRDTCPACGSFNVHIDGYYYTNARRYPEYECQGCGKWWKGKKAILNG